MARRLCAAILWRRAERWCSRGGIERTECKRGWFTAAIIRKVGAKLALNCWIGTISGVYRRRRAFNRPCSRRKFFSITSLQFPSVPDSLEYGLSHRSAEISDNHLAKTRLPG